MAIGKLGLAKILILSGGSFLLGIAVSQPKIQTWEFLVFAPLFIIGEISLLGMGIEGSMRVLRAFGLKRNWTTAWFNPVVLNTETEKEEPPV